MDDKLQSMKNLGKTSAQWLNAVGIHSIGDLQRVGAINAYRAVKNRGFPATKVLMYAIEAALEDRCWREITTERKELLNSQLSVFEPPPPHQWRTQS